MNTLAGVFGRITQRTVVQSLLMLMLLWSVACQATATATVVNEQGGHRTIFAKSDAEKDNVVYGDVVGELSYWTPTEKQIEKFEQNLSDHFAEEGSDLANKLWTYDAQFAGYEKDADRFIYGNYYCTASFIDDDHTRWVFVLDGGDCFFQAQFNLESGLFERVYINGEA